LIDSHSIRVHNLVAGLPEIEHLLPIGRWALDLIAATFCSGPQSEVP
jgi:hypothetical protein